MIRGQHSVSLTEALQSHTAKKHEETPHEGAFSTGWSCSTKFGDFSEDLNRFDAKR